MFVRDQKHIHVSLNVDHVKSVVMSYLVRHQFVDHGVSSDRIEVDFQEVLEKKNALVGLRQTICELEATQEALWSPVVLNGSGFGVFANHSLVLASYISRANAAILDLRELLAQG